MQITEPWHTAVSPVDSTIHAVNNPHGMPDPLPAGYRQSLEFAPQGGLQIVTDIPMELFDPSVVRTYPQAYTGVKDRQLPGKHALLPCKVTDLSELRTAFRVNMMLGVDAQFNCAAEIFIHDSASPRNEQGPEDTRLYEIMFWTHKPASPTIGLGEILLDNENFELRYKPGTRNYVAFMLKAAPNPTDPVQIDWLQLLAIVNTVANETGLIDLIPDGYVTAVEVGSEGWAGSQALEINDFQTRGSKGVSPVTEPMPQPTPDDPGQAPIPLLGLIARMENGCSCLAHYLQGELNWPNQNGPTVSRLMVRDLRKTLVALEAEYERQQQT